MPNKSLDASGGSVSQRQKEKGKRKKEFAPPRQLKRSASFLLRDTA
jgi:hypothetical protein